MLSKEQGITVIGVCAVYELCVRQGIVDPRDLFSTSSPFFGGCCFQRVCVLVMSGLSLLLVRLRVMGAQLPAFTRFDNPAAASDSALARGLTFNYLASVNWWLLLNPCDLICDWTMDTVPLVKSLLVRTPKSKTAFFQRFTLGFYTFQDPRNLSTISTYATFVGLALAAVSSSKVRDLKCSSSNNNNHSPKRLNRPRQQQHQRRESSTIVLCLSMIVFPFLPASNLFFPVGFVVAERVLYLPSMGFCLLVAVGWDRARRRMATSKVPLLVWTYLLPLALLAAHGTKTAVRNSEWSDELNLFTSGLKVSSGNAKLFNNVGHAHEAKGSHERALRYFRRAVEVQPDDIGGHINVGRTLNNLKMFSEAEEAYLKAKSLLPKASSSSSSPSTSSSSAPQYARVAPNHLNVFLNLATLISKNGSRLEEADSLYRQAISMRSDYTQAYINRGDVLIKLNRTAEAQAVYEKALTFEEDNADLLYNMGVVMLSQNKVSQALWYLDRALESDPDHPQALLNSAILIQESRITRLSQVAIERLMKIVSKGGANERVYFNLGMLSMDSGDAEAAEAWFRKAIEVSPGFRSALFNLALLLSESEGRALDSGPVLRQLLSHHPDHVKGLILLGDLYVNHLGDLAAAERCYRRILDLDPGNVQGLHNLCVVILEGGDLPGARECLRKATVMAPGEEYIRRHLGIVEDKIRQQNLAGKM